MNNKYDIQGEIATIHFSKRDGSSEQCIIDAEDIPKLSEKCSLHLSRSDYSRKKYHTYIKIYFNEDKRQYLHRFLLDAPEGRVVDHINGNTLDNRKTNLRLVNNKENIENQNNVRSNSTSGMKGVSFLKNRNRWRAYITIDGKSEHLGCFGTAEEAKVVADNARSKYLPASPEARNIKIDSAKDYLREINKIRPNNKTGYPNVSWDNRLKKWNVKIRKKRKMIINEYFDEFEKAVKIAKETREELEKS